ncbi:MAG: hypothetical protein ACR2HQ_03940 [Ilumatobacteraceae bacterium]
MSDRARRWWAVLGLLVVAVVVFRLARTMQENGHGWGDDFAMYINQARGLVDGSADEVVATNRFALDNSAYRFGPVAYPWGFPALLAPIVMISGIDYSALKLVGTLSLVGAVLLYFALLEPRLEPWESVIAVALVALNSWYLAWTDMVLSDLPFLCSLLLSLYLLDRLVRGDRLLTAPTLTLTVVGVMFALSFHIRREALVLLFALAAAQCARLVTGSDRIQAIRRNARALLTPYLTFAAVAGVIHFIRPAAVISRDLGETGWHNVGFNVDFYRNPLAEMLGLKDAGPTEITLFGRPGLGTAMLAVVLALSAVGVLGTVVRHLRRDLHLVAAFVGLALTVLAQPFREGRYLYSIVPLLIYFAFQGGRAVLAALPSRRSVARAVRLTVPSALMLVLLASVTSDTLHALEYHRVYEYTHWGPEAPESQALFATIEQLTDERDVIVFHQARTMALSTRRRAIQGNSVSMMLERGDWYAMVKNSDYIQTPLTDEGAAELGFVKVWENSAYVLWEIPDRQVVPGA